MEAFFHETAWWLCHLLAAVLCLAGIAVSVLSFTGGWLVAAAAGLLYLCRDDGGPGLWLTAAFIAVCILVELFDFFAGSLGIKRRGGSSAAGWAALGGGFIGMLLGAFIPLPVLGSILGMCAGSFLCAFAVEYRRLRHQGKAARIARGAVWARLGVMFVKTASAMGMTGLLWFEVIR